MWWKISFCALLSDSRWNYTNLKHIYYDKNKMWALISQCDTVWQMYDNTPAYSYSETLQFENTEIKKKEKSIW